MCDPITIAGLALSAAGTVAHGAAQSRVRRAQDARSAAESDRQRRLSDEASAAFQRSLANQGRERSEEHTSELQSLMRTSYAVFCLKKKTSSTTHTNASAVHESPSQL